MMQFSARKRDSGSWVKFEAPSLEPGILMAARKLGLNGRVLTWEQVGAESWEARVGDTSLIIVAREMPRSGKGLFAFRDDARKWMYGELEF
jgi:hypothetical protein